MLQICKTRLLLHGMELNAVIKCRSKTPQRSFTKASPAHLWLIGMALLVALTVMESAEVPTAPPIQKRLLKTVCSFEKNFEGMYGVVELQDAPHTGPRAQIRFGTK